MYILLYMSGNILKSLFEKCAHYCKERLGVHIIRKRKMAQPDQEKFIKIGDFEVFAWSISGIETSVVVKNPTDGFVCCFDMGCSSRENVKCKSVMISHGHMDHISAIPQHIKKRELYGAKQASYFVPKYLVGDVKELCTTYAKICENSEDLKDLGSIVGVDPGDEIKLDKGYHAMIFPTVHRVRSQGYMVYKARKQLRTEYQGLSSKEIGIKIKDGENVHTDPIVTPEIAFTGDTTFQVFTDEVYIPPPDLFRVKLLIVEATYINDDCNIETRVQQARKWGHIHLSEIYENAHLFKDVDNILLIHMSDKYSCSYIQEKVFKNIPDSLKGKIHVSTIAKERYL